MKKMFRILSVSVLGLFLLAGPAMSLTLPASYSWINAPFWTNTDLTTGANGNSQFQLTFEAFTGARDADFGLFYVADISAPSSPTLFEVFDKTVEPLSVMKTVSFRTTGSVYEITLDVPNGSAIWTPFSQYFGFYFDFDGAGGPPNETYFSYFGLDTLTPSNRNVFSANNGFNEVLIYLDRFPNASGNLTEPSMTVYGNDLAPASVPEPGTLLLLGSGLMGLAFYGRKRMKA